MELPFFYRKCLFVQSNNKIIAKNTIFLYARMLVSTLVSLYTSRVVLQVLGVEDYGVYGVVGGIVGMFSFLNSAMAGATSRFLTFELGRGDKDRLKTTFSSALIVHVGIALVIFFLADSVGLWFLHHKLVIPDGRMDAANWVLQCSIISMFFTVTQVPYNATIISHEKMEVYAYVELLNVFLKLGIVYLLTIGNFDKLKLYAVLMLSVSIIIAMVNRVYCLRHYEESHFQWDWDTDIIRPMISFSGWDIFGNMSHVFKLQGTNFVVNFICGVAVNAACGVATTVQGVIQSFSGNVTQAFRPAIIKDYSCNRIDNMQIHMSMSLRFGLVMLFYVTIPLIVESDYVMGLWLGTVPKYASVFCQLLLINNIISMVTNTFIIAIHSTGRIKDMSALALIINVMTVFLIYFTLKTYPEYPTLIYFITILTSILNSIMVIYLTHRLIPLLNVGKIVKEVISTLCVGFITYLLIYYIHTAIPDGLLRLLLGITLNLLVISILSFLFVLKEGEKSEVVNKFICLLSKNK